MPCFLFLAFRFSLLLIYNLFAYIYGEDDAFRRSITGEWYLALQFKMDSETEVWKEVINTLSSEFVSNNMSSTELRIVVQNHVDRFP